MDCKTITSTIKYPRSCLLLLAASVRDIVNYIKPYHGHCPPERKGQGQYKTWNRTKLCRGKHEKNCMLKGDMDLFL